MTGTRLVTKIIAVNTGLLQAPVFAAWLKSVKIASHSWAKGQDVRFLA